MLHVNNAKDVMASDTNVAELGLLVAPGAVELGKLIDAHLSRWAKEAGRDEDTFIIPSECPRFSSGDGKGMIKQTVTASA